MNWLAALWNRLFGKKPKRPAPPTNTIQLEDGTDMLTEDGQTVDMES